jgi:hypothetical protein
MQHINGYEGKYSISQDGKIFASPSNKRPKGCVLRPWLIGNGYEMVMLYKSKKPKKYLVHRLVAETFIPNPLGLSEVNHKDGNRLNNSIDNLEWVSSKQNKQHAISMGLYSKLCSLTETDVREIRRLYASGNYFQREIADMFNTTQFNVSWIVRGKGWSHIL